jgi:hypothetical protein
MKRNEPQWFDHVRRMARTRISRRVLELKFKR